MDQCVVIYLNIYLYVIKFVIYQLNKIFKLIYQPHDSCLINNKFILENMLIFFLNQSHNSIKNTGIDWKKYNNLSYYLK